MIIRILLFYLLVRNIYLILKRKIKIKKKYKYNIKNIVSINIGSSHSDLAFRSLKSKKNHLNLAHTSQTLYYDELLLQNFKKDIVKNKDLICFLTLSYFSLYSPKLWKKEDIENYYDSLKISYFEKENKIFVFLYRYFPIIYKNFTKLKKSIIKENKKNNIESRIKKHIHILKEQKYLKFNIQTLEKIILFCNENDIRLILLTTPFKKEYNKYFSEELLTNNFYNEIKKIKNKYKIQYFDFSKDYKNFSEDSYFEDYDYDHLSLKGSKKFIEVLNERLNKKGVKYGEKSIIND